MGNKDRPERKEEAQAAEGDKPKAAPGKSGGIILPK